MKLLLLDRPTDNRIVSERDVEFFGPWAQPITSPEDLLKPSFEAYPTIENVNTAALDAIKMAHKILDSLCDILPDLTGQNRGRRFWKCFLGYHIIALTSVVEDIKRRHVALKDEAYILGLPEKRYEEANIPYFWKDAQLKLFEDNGFRWHAMSLYLKTYYKNVEFIKYIETPKRILSNRISDLYIKASHLNLKTILNMAIARIFKYDIRLNKQKMFNVFAPALFVDEYKLKDVNFEKLDATRLPKNFLPNIDIMYPFEVDWQKRNKILQSIPFPYGKLLSILLPIVAIEGAPYIFKKIEGGGIEFNGIEKIYTFGPVLGSSGNEASRKFLLSLLADEGKRIVSIQHGGGSTYFSHSIRFMERFVADEHITWGRGYSSNTELPDINSQRVCPSIYLSNLKKKSCSKRYKIIWDVIFLVLEEGRHTKWLYGPLFPDMAYDYFRRQKVLFDFFCVRKKVAIKIYPQEYGWGQTNWIKRNYSSSKLLISGKFVDYALRSKIVIVDYNSTGFLEMLAMKKPFLATWNRRWFKGGKIFEEHIDRLKDVGVFHEQSEDLIRAYNEKIMPDVDSWWRNEIRQDVIRKMANAFALTSDNVYEEWNIELGK